MEMSKLLFIVIIIFGVISCSNTPDLETGEIKILEVMKYALDQKNKPKAFIDAKTLLTRRTNRCS